MALARLYTFTAGTTIASAQVGAELDQLVQILNGTKLDTVLIKSASAGAATLTVDNTGGGKVVEFLVAGAAKAKINPTGQIESLLATGTAPLVVASSTLVTNLNADQLDGHDSTYFLPATDPVVLANGTGRSVLALSTFGYLRGVSGSLQLLDGAGASILSLDTATKNATFAALVSSTGTPTAAAHLTRKDYVDGKKAAFSWVVEVNDPLASSDGGRFVVPSSVSNFTLRKIHLVPSGGTSGSNPPGASVNRYNSAGTFQASAAGPTIPTGTFYSTPATLTQTLGSPMSCSAGDVLAVTFSAGSGTCALTELTIVLEGDYTIA